MKDVAAKISQIVRLIFISALIVVLCFTCVVRLLQIHVIDAGMYDQQALRTYTATQTLQAVRGRIIDSNGLVLNTNELSYNVILQRAFLPVGGENEVIAGILDVLIKHGHEWRDNIPILLEPTLPRKGFQFKNVPEEELDKFKVNLGLNYDATVENCIKALAENYKINTDRYDRQMVRYIGGVRYEMERKDFSFRNFYLFAEDISLDMIIELREKALILRGVDIADSAVRVYLEGERLPHVRGRINAINAEQYEALKDSGYSINDTIGFFGLEMTKESVLRGENGIREITRDGSGEVLSDEIVKPAIAGHTIKLTIDTDFQQTLQEILANHISWINRPGASPRRPWTETGGGSIVVLDVTTGGILGMANYPTFNGDDYLDLVLAEMNGEPPLPHNPLIDRSAGHGYRPGSSFKPLTGAAGLIHGVVGRHDTVNCRGRYNFFSDYSAGCVGPFGHVNIVSALVNSSNCYFYDVGRRVGIEKLNETWEGFGVGQNLNCDFPMYPGRMVTPETYEALHGSPLTGGNIIQASIGQSEMLLTPLHMATAAMTIANNGKRLRPHLVHSVWNYDGTELIRETQPEVVYDMNPDGIHDAAFAAVQEGMHALGQRQRHYYVHLPYLPAYKTGTPEIISKRLYNSAIIGYYPYDNPKIAFGIMLEGGEYSRRAIRNIIDAYFYDCYEPAPLDSKGHVSSHWKAWTRPFPEPIPGRYNSDE